MSRIDFDDAARKLFSSLGLNPEGAGRAGMRGMYNPLDPIWRDTKTDGTIYVGNQQAAQNAAMLNMHSITHVVRRDRGQLQQAHACAWPLRRY